MSTEPTLIREWLSLELDGTLAPEQQQLLEARVAADPELATERRQYRRLGEMLDGGRVAVRPGFARTVLDSLPAAGWEARHPRSWRLTLAVLVVLAAASAALVGGGSARLAPESPFLGAIAAVADLFATALVTGVTLLAASWKGVGLALAEVLAGSVTGMAAFILFVVSLNLLFLALLRRSRKQAPARRRSGEPPPSA